jgi:hypothetical protein
MIRMDHIHRNFVISSINIDSGGNVSELPLNNTTNYTNPRATAATSPTLPSSVLSNHATKGICNEVQKANFLANIHCTVVWKTTARVFTKYP